MDSCSHSLYDSPGRGKLAKHQNISDGPSEENTEQGSLAMEISDGCVGGVGEEHQENTW